MTGFLVCLQGDVGVCALSVTRTAKEPVMFAFVCVALLAAAAPAAALPITAFGAIAFNSSDAVSVINAAAITKTFLAANASSDRVVLIPAGMNFTMFPVNLADLSGVTLQVDGALIVNKNITSSVWQRGGGDYGVIHIVGVWPLLRSARFLCVSLVYVIVLCLRWPIPCSLPPVQTRRTSPSSAVACTTARDTTGGGSSSSPRRTTARTC